MAEAFANHYGADVLVAASAGLAPTTKTPPDTVRAMDEMNVDVSGHIPRRYEPFEVTDYDLVINMAGFKLPGPPPREVVEWQVTDPFGANLDVYRMARNDVEQRVMRLILDLRRKAR
jgi:protein-tyrosine-phosphatase